MKLYRLLLYQKLSRRVRGTLSLLLTVLTAVGLYDQYNPVLGDYWYLWWIANLAAFVLWFYYVILMARTSLQLRPTAMRLQGPIGRLTISYGRIRSTTSTQISHHYPPGDLRGGERRLLEPLHGTTAVFIELSSVPRSFRFRRLWFPRLLFGTTNPGLLLLVEDWMALSQDVDVARDKWREQRAARRREDNRSIVARILGS